ncbi:MAG: tripartite tricarboxylate transporter permease [Planctomycetota bacterium]|nr:tripartite tricarboxylate transporter permease [Planctomycetota bacterium]
MGISGVIGLGIGSVFSLLPGLHVYNIAGLILLYSLAHPGAIAEQALPGLMLGMVVGYAFVSNIPSLFLGAPDESAIFVVLPGQKYMMSGRGYEAAMLMGVGSLLALVALMLATPFLVGVLPDVKTVLRPHMFWILAAVLLFLVMSEWPKGTDREKTGIGRWLGGWRNVGAGLLTMAVSGFLGIVLMNSAILPSEAGFQGFMPVFIGLFAIPMVLTNIISNAPVPKQHFSTGVDLTWGTMLRGAGGGVLGGLFAATFPVVTGGIGGLLAGHATAQRDDRSFVVSQGANKLVYYVGAFLLFFLPGSGLGKGGMASMTSIVYSPKRPEEFYALMGIAALMGVVAFFFSLFAARLTVRILARVDYRRVSLVTLVLALVLVAVPFYSSGVHSLIMAYAVTLVSAGIGMLPVAFGARRVNCMAVLLVPLIINMSGLGPPVLRFLGL